MSHNVLLIKILPSERAEFLLDGKLYMNSDNYFTKIENSDSVRCDPDENADEVWQIEKYQIKEKDGNWLTVNGIKNPALYRSEKQQKYNIYCLYALSDYEGFHFDNRNLAFGDSAVVIANAIEFLNRLNIAVEKEGKRLYHDMIEYVDRQKYYGYFGPFKKFSKFAYQSEFRIAINGGNGSHVILELGDIRDIAFVCPSREIEIIHSARVKKIQLAQQNQSTLSLRSG